GPRGPRGPDGPRRGGMRFAMLNGTDATEETPVFFSAKTDAGGAYALEAEGDGPFNLRVDAPGFAPALVEKAKGGDAAITVPLQRGVSASGAVGDLATGTPLPDAEVMA